jgi:hypothetical protein
MHFKGHFVLTYSTRRKMEQEKPSKDLQAQENQAMRIGAIRRLIYGAALHLLVGFCKNLSRRASGMRIKTPFTMPSNVSVRIGNSSSHLRVIWGLARLLKEIGLLSCWEAECLLFFGEHQKPVSVTTKRLRSLCRRGMRQRNRHTALATIGPFNYLETHMFMALWTTKLE